MKVFIIVRLSTRSGKSAAKSIPMAAPSDVPSMWGAFPADSVKHRSDVFNALLERRHFVPAIRHAYPRLSKQTQVKCFPRCSSVLR